jgi:phosphatidylglycerol lysyltransferase
MNPSVNRRDDGAASDERRRALDLVRRHGWNATSFQTLEHGFRYWFHGDDACVAYVDTGRAWVAAGAPIAPAARIGPVAADFARAARAARRRVRFFAVEARFTRAAALDALHVGEQPVWDPGAWNATLRSSRSLREQLRRARARGVAVRTVSAAEMSDPASPTRRAVEALIARWLRTRAMAPMGFLVDVQPFTFPEERRYLVAEWEGRVVAFLAAVPVYARRGWFLEDLLRDPRAPNGTAEVLVDAAMKLAATEGSCYVTLGLAPLAGDVPCFLRVARDWASPLYDFNGLRAFKARLRPQQWEPLYLAYPRGERGYLALWDTLTAFARGSMVRFGLRTVMRGPVVVVRALAALLIPWTAMLALVDARHWFPAPWVKWAWVLFDCGLCAALFALAARWRGWLATLLSALITADAVLTLAQVVAFNAPRARSAGDGVAIAVACLAPALAAAILWSARAARGSSSEERGGPVAA